MDESQRHDSSPSADESSLIVLKPWCIATGWAESFLSGCKLSLTVAVSSGLLLNHWNVRFVDLKKNNKWRFGAAGSVLTNSWNFIQITIYINRFLRLHPLPTSPSLPTCQHTTATLPPSLRCVLWKKLAAVVTVVWFVISDPATLCIAQLINHQGTCRCNLQLTNFELLLIHSIHRHNW